MPISMPHTESTTPEGADAAAAAPANANTEDLATASVPADAPVTEAAEAPHAGAPGGAREAGDCAAELKRRFPALFTGPAKPLKLKIQADIQQRAPGVFGKHELSAFFRRYTGSTSYLIAMTRSPHRFDLDGQQSGEVSAEHRQAALDELARRRANHQAKIDQQEEARRKRASLLRDFETTTLTPANFCALKGIAPQALDALLATARREREERAQQQPMRHAGGPGGPGPRGGAGAPGPRGGAGGPGSRGHAPGPRGGGEGRGPRGGQGTRGPQSGPRTPGGPLPPEARDARGPRPAQGGPNPPRGPRPPRAQDARGAHPASPPGLAAAAMPSASAPPAPAVEPVDHSASTDAASPVEPTDDRSST
jgi:sRNA-binding protein